MRSQSCPESPASPPSVFPIHCCPETASGTVKRWISPGSPFWRQVSCLVWYTMYYLMATPMQGKIWYIPGHNLLKCPSDFDAVLVGFIQIVIPCGVMVILAVCPFKTLEICPPGSREYRLGTLYVVMVLWTSATNMSQNLTCNGRREPIQPDQHMFGLDCPIL